MPKIVEVQVLRSVTAGLVASFREPVSEIAKRNNVGRQWVYHWEAKLEYHGLHRCEDLSDEILVALRDNVIYTPPRRELKLALERKSDLR